MPPSSHDQHQVHVLARHGRAPRVGEGGELGVAAHERVRRRCDRHARQTSLRPGRSGVAQEGEVQVGRCAVRIGAEVVAQRPRQPVVRRQRRRDLSVCRECPHEVAHGPLVVGILRHAGRCHRGRARGLDLDERGHPLVSRVATQRVGLAAHLEDPVVVVLVRQRRAGAEQGLGCGGRGLGQGELAGSRPAGGLRTPQARLLQVQRPRAAKSVSAGQAHDDAAADRMRRRRLTRVATLAAGSLGGSPCHSASTMRSVVTAAPRAEASRASRVRALRLPRALPVSAPAAASTARVDDRRSRTTPSCVLTEPSIRPDVRSGQAAVPRDGAALGSAHEPLAEVLQLARRVAGQPAVHRAGLEHGAARRLEEAEPLTQRLPGRLAPALVAATHARRRRSRASHTWSTSTSGSRARRRSASTCHATSRKSAAWQYSTTPTLTNSSRSGRGTQRSTTYW